MKENLPQLKPQDVVLLMKIVSLEGVNWNQIPMAEALEMSQSEISAATARLKYAGLLQPNGKNVMQVALMEFLQFGIRYVFPQKPGPVVRGVATSHSASPLKEHILSNENYVWPYSKGNMRGQSILPLYPTVPQAALKDPKLHELLALVDALRVGRAREREFAMKVLSKKIRNGK